MLARHLRHVPHAEEPPVAFAIPDESYTYSSSATTSPSYTFPTYNAGNYVIAVVFPDADVTVSALDGFTTLSTIGGGSGRVWCGYRVMTGAEGSTWDPTLSSAQESICKMWTVSGADAASGATNYNGFPFDVDPPNLSPGWGTVNMLWFTGGYAPSGSPTPPGTGPGEWATNWETHQESTMGAVFSWVEDDTVSSKNPTTLWTIGDTAQKGFTIAVRDGT